jgi:hypothetical protein
MKCLRPPVATILLRHLNCRRPQFIRNTSLSPTGLTPLPEKILYFANVAYLTASSTSHAFLLAALPAAT